MAPSRHSTVAAAGRYWRKGAAEGATGTLATSRSPWEATPAAGGKGRWEGWGGSARKRRRRQAVAATATARPGAAALGARRRSPLVSHPPGRSVARPQLPALFRAGSGWVGGACRGWLRASEDWRSRQGIDASDCSDGAFKALCCCPAAPLAVCRTGWRDWLLPEAGCRLVGARGPSSCDVMDTGNTTTACMHARADGSCALFSQLRGAAAAALRRRLARVVLPLIVLALLRGDAPPQQPQQHRAGIAIPSVPTSEQVAGQRTERGRGGSGGAAGRGEEGPGPTWASPCLAPPRLVVAASPTPARTGAW